MYKLILLSLMTCIMTNVYASNTSYIVKYPLSAGSFIGTLVPPVVVPTPKPPSTCVYNYPSTYWLAGLNGVYDILSVVENGKTVGNAKGYATTSFTFNNTTYSRGAAKELQGPYTRYEVCKTQ